MNNAHRQSVLRIAPGSTETPTWFTERFHRYAINHYCLPRVYTHGNKRSQHRNPRQCRECQARTAIINIDPCLKRKRNHLESTAPRNFPRRSGACSLCLCGGAARRAEKGAREKRRQPFLRHSIQWSGNAINVPAGEVVGRPPSPSRLAVRRSPGNCATSLRASLPPAKRRRQR
jgi:hypothetical protein